MKAEAGVTKKNAGMAEVMTTRNLERDFMDNNLLAETKPDNERR